MSRNWTRVPTWLGGRLRGERVASDVEAWTDLLCRWRQGEDPGPRALMRDWKWGAGRTMAFTAKVVEWARENGADLPERLAMSTGTNRNASGTAAEHLGTDADGIVEAPRNAAGTIAEQIGTSHARASSSSREKREERGDTRAREPAKLSVPETLDELLGGEVAWSRPARALAVAGVTPEVLVRMTERDLSMVPGVAGAWRVIAEACKRAGFPLEPGTPDRTARREAPRETLPERPKPPPGSPQQEGEEFFEFVSRKQREIKAGIRDWHGNPIPKVAHG